MDNWRGRKSVHYSYKGTLGNYKIESKSKSLVYVPSNSALDVLVSNFNKISSSVYNSSPSFPVEWFSSHNGNEDITPKDLIKVVEDHEKQTVIMNDTILINLGNF